MDYLVAFQKATGEAMEDISQATLYHTMRTEIMFVTEQVDTIAEMQMISKWIPRSLFFCLQSLHIWFV